MARMGRPVAVAADLNPFDGEQVDVRGRIGWLLRVNRLASSDPDARSLAVFARRLQELGLVVDAPRLSGWEQGKGVAPRAVMAGYARLLGLPEGQLRSVADGLRNSLGGEVLCLPKDSRADEAELQRRLDTAYEAVDDPGTHGGQWLRLAELLCDTRAALLPTRLVEPLVQRLVTETMRAVGTAYTTRFGALTRLVNHPHWHGMVNRGVQTAVQAPGAQGVVDAMSLLGEIADQASVRWLLQAFREDTGSIQRGAAYSLLNALLSGTFPPGELDVLERLLGQMRVESPTGPSARLVRMLVERLDPERQVRLGVAPAPGVGPGDPLGTARVRQSGAAGETQSLKVIAPFLAGLRQALPDVRDPMVQRLLREALASRYVERRHQASLLLMASPYRSAVAATAATLTESTPDSRLRGRTSALLGYVSGEGEREVLHRWLLYGRPELQHAALMSLAHGPGVDHTVDLAGLVALRGPLAGAAVYAGGMSGHPALHVWAADVDAPLSLRQAARWWLATGPVVRDDPAA